MGLESRLREIEDTELGLHRGKRLSFVLECPSWGSYGVQGGRRQGLERWSNPVGLWWQ